MAPRDADSTLDKLFQAPLEEFTRTRNELAAAAKAAGDAEKSKAMKALAKPSVSAWAVNQLYWKARRDYDALMKAGERQRDVQQAVLEGRRGDLRKVSEERQEALVAALDRAMKLAADAGHPESATLRQRLAKTLESLAAYGGSPPDGTPGRLTRDLDPPGFGALAGLTDLVALAPVREAPPARRGKEKRGKAARAPGGEKILPHDRELARARAELAEAEREAKRLRGQADRAEAASRLAAEREKTAQEDVEEAERALERAKERARKATEESRGDARVRPADKRTACDDEVHRQHP